LFSGSDISGVVNVRMGILGGCGVADVVSGQDYTLASLGLLDAEAIHKAGLNVIV
jgi:hypothetical protein